MAVATKLHDAWLSLDGDGPEHPGVGRSQVPHEQRRFVSFEGHAPPAVAIGRRVDAYGQPPAKTVSGDLEDGFLARPPLMEEPRSARRCRTAPSGVSPRREEPLGDGQQVASPVDVSTSMPIGP